MTSTEALIERLAADAAPVRRLRPPLARATLWLVPVLTLGVIAILLWSNLGVMHQRMRLMALDVEMAGSLATGIAGVIAAFALSVPGRDWRWIFLPWPALAVWLGASGTECYRHWLIAGMGGFALGESAACLKFIVGLGLPLTATLLWALWRAQPLAPGRVAFTGALGAAGLSAFLLQFFHPFDVSMMDLGVHAASMALLVAVATLFGTRLGAG